METSERATPADIGSRPTVVDRILGVALGLEAFYVLSVLVLFAFFFSLPPDPGEETSSPVVDALWTGAAVVGGVLIGLAARIAWSARSRCGGWQSATWFGTSGLHLAAAAYLVVASIYSDSNVSDVGVVLVVSLWLLSIAIWMLLVYRGAARPG